MTKAELIEWLYDVESKANNLYSPDGGAQDKLGIVAGDDPNESMDEPVDERIRDLLWELSQTAEKAQSQALHMIEILEGRA